MLVIDQRGSMEMWTRERWDAEVYRQDTKKKRCRDCHTKPCQCVVESIDWQGQKHMFLKNQMSVAQDSDMEWLDQFAARQQEWRLCRQVGQAFSVHPENPRLYSEKSSISRGVSWQSFASHWLQV